MSLDTLKMEKMFLAFADVTRLRLINLMRNGEVCVNELEKVLGENQPKISRHLAYLRNAGLVTTRRDGRHIYYSIDRPDDVAASDVLASTLAWMEQNSAMQSEFARVDAMPQAKYEVLVEPTPKRKRANKASGEELETLRAIDEMPEGIIVEEDQNEEYQPTFFHNEIDDFLL